MLGPLIEKTGQFDKAVAAVKKILAMQDLDEFASVVPDEVAVREALIEERARELVAAAMNPTVPEEEAVGAAV